MAEPRWWIGAPGSALKGKPVAVTILGTPLVLFRDAGAHPKALYDRCPHRGFPLSPGTCRKGTIVCSYHGWAFDGQGVCRHQPAPTKALPDTPMVESYPVIERDGYVWVSLQGSAGEPPDLALLQGAWQPWTQRLAVPVDRVAAQLRATGEWQALHADRTARGEAVAFSLPASARPSLLVHLIPEQAELTRLEVLEGPSRWLDLGPRRFRLPKSGLPPPLHGLLQDLSPADRSIQS